MPSDFVEGRPGQKTLVDLIETLEDGPRERREPFRTSPLSGAGPYQGSDRKRSNRETESKRRRRLARQALKELKGDDAESSG